MDGESGKCAVTYPLKKWASSCEVSTRKFRNFAETLVKLGLIFLEKDENLWVAECPNLLKYRDEYTTKKMRNSGHSPDGDRSLSDQFVSVSNSVQRDSKLYSSTKGVSSSTVPDDDNPFGQGINTETGEVLQ